jgi:hypothetical protein
MAVYSSAIGKSLNNGFPGQFAQQGPKVAITAPNAGDTDIYFGDPVFSYNGGVAGAGAASLVPTFSLFKGVALAHVQTANSYNSQSLGGYPSDVPVPVIEEGGVVVYVSNASGNAPTVDGAVYVRIANGTTAKPVNGFEAAADSTTYTATVTTQTSGSASIVVSAVTNLAVGMTVSGTGIPSGAYITAINASTLTVTISAAATSTASSGTLTFGSNTIQIANTTWGTVADSNGVALLVLKTRNNS